MKTKLWASMILASVCAAAAGAGEPEQQARNQIAGALQLADGEVMPECLAHSLILD
jgi:hypothetical protein